MRSIANGVMAFLAAIGMSVSAELAFAQNEDAKRVAIIEKCTAQAKAAHPEDSETAQRQRAGVYYACMTAAGQRP
jgi:hypothetical protein